MSEDEILAMTVASIRAADSHPCLWVPDTHLPLGLGVVRAWDFEFKHLIVWAKATSTGRPHIGMGHYFRKAHEVCLFALAGRAKVVDRSLPSWFAAPSLRPRAKPEELQDLAERASPGPRLELFARRRRDGWTTWGDAL